MDLPDRSSSEWLQLEGFEPLRPLVAKIALKCLLDLLLRHDVGLFSCLFEGLPNGRRDEIVLLDAEHLCYFERSAPHLA